MSDELDKLEEIICNAGSPVADCEFCGRVHFAGSTGYFDAGEYDALVAKAKKEPKKYIEHGNDDSVSHGVFHGKTFVWGCDCGAMAQREAMLWSNRRVILEFIRRRAERIRKTGQDTLDELKKIGG